MAKPDLTVSALRHKDAKRRNIPTAELEPVMRPGDKAPVRLAIERRNRDLDPQLVWRGKDEQDWSDLIVQAPPLYIQEKIHPKALIDDLLRHGRDAKPSGTPDLFADFNGLPDREAITEFYQHDAHWSNRMILGDSLQVMASLAEREGLRGKVQCIYIDPPYGIRFNSNFQWSTTSRDVKDGNKDHITREPEQVKAFRDTWREGIHSYLTYLRDRLTVARDLLCESGSVFVQIGSEHCHLLRAALDEIFGTENFISQIIFSKTAGATSEFLSGTYDVILFYAKRREKLKYRQPLTLKQIGGVGGSAYTRARLSDLKVRQLTHAELQNPKLIPADVSVFRIDNLTSQSVGRDKGEGAASWFPVEFDGKTFRPSEKVRWKTNQEGMSRLLKSDRLNATAAGLYYRRYFSDFLAFPEDDVWSDTGIAGFASDKRYVVETSEKVVQRCLLMATDPGDLVLDPTCGSGTTATVAEQWGRRWITVDTSRVALALARARIMGARYPYYLLADSPEGQRKEAEITRAAPKETPTRGDVRQGFVYERVPHITLKSIANNAEIDVIWEEFQPTLEQLRVQLNTALNTNWQEWEIPREASPGWSRDAGALHAEWWRLRIERQRRIDASIAAKAETEYLHDKPYADPSRVRVAGPFTVETLSPHRVLAVDQDDELVFPEKAPSPRPSPTRGEGDEKAPSPCGRGLGEGPDFAQIMLDTLRASGVQQAHKEDRISFTTLTGWPGTFICAEGRYMEGETERRAGILIGPEFGTVSRPDLVAAAREAADAGFDVLVACAFNFDAHSSELSRLGRIPVLKARMNPDLHMAGELKNTGAGNLFVVFGEPDIAIEDAGEGRLRVRIKGVDVFKPQTGEIESGGPDTIALWMLDTDYNEESFFVRHAYFLGANDPYKALRTTLRAEIDEDAWATLRGDTSRPFLRPNSGRIAVKVINHLGDEVMKVFAA